VNEAHCQVLALRTRWCGQRGSNDCIRSPYPQRGASSRSYQPRGKMRQHVTCCQFSSECAPSPCGKTTSLNQRQLSPAINRRADGLLTGTSRHSRPITTHYVSLNPTRIVGLNVGPRAAGAKKISVIQLLTAELWKPPAPPPDVSFRPIADIGSILFSEAPKDDRHRWNGILLVPLAGCDS
jgi:hypothetical protein